MRPQTTRARPVVENRRTPRIERRIPLRIEWNEDACYATTTDVNRDGAHILSAKALEDEHTVRITNLDSGLSQLFWIVWCRGRSGQQYEAGVELLAANVDFWGADYRPDPAE